MAPAHLPRETHQTKVIPCLRVSGGCLNVRKEALGRRLGIPPSLGNDKAQENVKTSSCPAPVRTDKKTDAQRLVVIQIRPVIDGRTDFGTK